MRGATRRGRRRRLGGVLLVVALLLAGCTYEDREPGLFGRTPAAKPSEVGSSPNPLDSSAAIPLLGEATWVPPDTRGIPIRIAIHGVRRVPGGTVLDWSITALSAAVRVPGELIEGGLPIGIDERIDVALVDASAGRVYRPLVSRDGSQSCLCAPVRLADDDLALDVPRLLQVAYPELPAAVRAIDVSVAPVPVFSRIPVTAVGEMSAPIAETDLARPVGPIETLARTPDFTLPSGQRFAIDVHAVLASGTLTSVVWSIEALARGPGPGSGLRPELARHDAWRVTSMRLRGADGAEPACLCTDPAGWKEYLEEPGRRITVVTNFGDIPRGTTTVDVIFPDVPPLRDLGVATASDGAFRAGGIARAPRQSWTYRTNRPQPGWRLYAWPTPAPLITKGDFAGRVDPILG
jgi:hypothetical protein